MSSASANSPSSPASALIAPGQVLTFVLITTLFFFWGLAANMTDTLLAAFKRILSLSDFQTAFVQYAFFGGYFCFSIPGAILAQRKGYKFAILCGLGLYITGALLFYPASIALTYTPFLVALYVLAAGLAFLETSANTFIFSLGAPETATRRLNLAQAFNPVGSIVGAFVAQQLILSHLHHASSAERASLSTGALRVMQTAELSAVMGPYVGVAAVLLFVWIAIAVKRLPVDAARGTDDRPQAFAPALGRLLVNRHYLTAVLVQFCYVGAQVGVWSFTIRYVMARLGLIEHDAANFYTAGLVVFFISRFVCTWAMGYVRAETLLAALALVAAALCTTAAFSHSLAGVYALVATNACMALMFPTIFGIGLRSLGADSKVGSAGLVMAISGGAAIVGLQAMVSDWTGDIGTAFLVPAGAFLVVCLFGLRHRRSAPLAAAELLH